MKEDVRLETHRNDSRVFTLVRYSLWSVIVGALTVEVSQSMHHLFRTGSNHSNPDPATNHFYPTFISPNPILLPPNPSLTPLNPSNPTLTPLTPLNSPNSSQLHSNPSYLPLPHSNPTLTPPNPTLPTL